MKSQVKLYTPTVNSMRLLFLIYHSSSSGPLGSLAKGNGNEQHPKYLPFWVAYAPHYFAPTAEKKQNPTKVENTFA